MMHGVVVLFYLRFGWKKKKKIWDENMCEWYVAEYAAMLEKLVEETEEEAWKKNVGRRLIA